MKKPVQVYFDEVDYRQIAKWAKTHGCSLSEAVREGALRYTWSEEDDPFLRYSGFLDDPSLPTDLAANFDHHLNETYEIERKRKERPGARPRRSPVRR